MITRFAIWWLSRHGYIVRPATLGDYICDIEPTKTPFLRSLSK